GPGPASELRDLVRRVHTIILGGLIHRNGRGQNPGRAAGLPVGTIPASLPPSLALTQPPPGTRGGDGAGCGPLPSPHPHADGDPGATGKRYRRPLGHHHPISAGPVERFCPDATPNSQGRCGTRIALAPAPPPCRRLCLETGSGQESPI